MMHLKWGIFSPVQSYFPVPVGSDTFSKCPSPWSPAQQMFFKPPALQPKTPHISGGISLQHLQSNWAASEG